MIIRITILLFFGALKGYAQYWDSCGVDDSRLLNKHEIQYLNQFTWGMSNMENINIDSSRAIFCSNVITYSKSDYFSKAAKNDSLKENPCHIVFLAGLNEKQRKKYKCDFLVMYNNKTPLTKSRLRRIMKSELERRQNILNEE